LEGANQAPGPKLLPDALKEKCLNLQSHRHSFGLRFYLPQFVFMPKLIQCAMNADANAAIEVFGNAHIKKNFPVIGHRAGRAGSGPGGGDYYGGGGVT
jgi:hypothetical protein